MAYTGRNHATERKVPCHCVSTNEGIRSETTKAVGRSTRINASGTQCQAPMTNRSISSTEEQTRRLHQNNIKLNQLAIREKRTGAMTGAARKTNRRKQNFESCQDKLMRIVKMVAIKPAPE